MSRSGSLRATIKPSSWDHRITYLGPDRYAIAWTACRAGTNHRARFIVTRRAASDFSQRWGIALPPAEVQ